MKIVKTILCERKTENIFRNLIKALDNVTLLMCSPGS